MEIMKDTVNQFCSICGKNSQFLCEADVSLREARCPYCGASQRNSDLAKIIMRTFSTIENISLLQAEPFLKNMEIYEAQSSGQVHDALCRLPHYTCSEFFNDIPSGQKNLNGILCQDLQNLTFPSDNFDLIITQDIFEHIREPEKAFVEIRRVLKPGGYHIFTIPYNEGKTTLRRITIEDGKEIQKCPPVYHGDPLRDQGALVFTDFGSDLITRIEKLGFSLVTIPCGIWYSPSEIPYIIDETSYETYLKYYHTNELCRFFKYNSWVFRSQKPETQVKNNA
jgi:SAM-dependent methyltransferase/DNA-directed RNA polymerase subunit RPC12/RpoP